MIASLGRWLSLFILASPFAMAEAVEGLKRFEFNETHMGSSFKVVLYSTDESTASRASQAAYNRIAELDSILSDYQPESELSRLSLKGGGPPVTVSKDLFDILERAKRIHQLTDGVFDVTIAPVGRLWRRARREHKLPDPQRIAEARAFVGSDKLILDPKRRTVQLLKHGMKLDVGGIAKGYASQAALDVLRSRGITRALVGGAGDIVVGDPPPNTSGWTVGIAPLNPEEEPQTYLLLKNAAISTSGDAERYVVIDGRRYSHIIDPQTGVGVTNRASVTLVAPDGATADSVATSVYMLGPEKGLHLADQIPGAAVLFLQSTPDGLKTFESSGFKKLPRTQAKQSVERTGDR